MTEPKKKLGAVDIIALLPVIKAILDQLAAGFKWLLAQWDARRARKEVKKIRDELFKELDSIDKELEKEVNDERRKELIDIRKSLLSKLISD